MQVGAVVGPAITTQFTIQGFPDIPPSPYGDFVVQPKTGIELVPRSTPFHFLVTINPRPIFDFTSPSNPTFSSLILTARQPFEAQELLLTGIAFELSSPPVTPAPLTCWVEQYNPSPGANVLFSVDPSTFPAIPVPAEIFGRFDLVWEPDGEGVSLLPSQRVFVDYSNPDSRYIALTVTFKSQRPLGIRE